MKRVLAAAAVLAGLVFAQGAIAAPNSASIAVSFNPSKLGATAESTLHVNVATTSDAIAQVNIFAPTGVGANLSQPAGTTIGTVDATAVAHAQGGLTLPLTGNVVTDDPAKHTADVCSPGTNRAVWNMNLSVAGQTLVIPIYVNPTTGATAALGAYNLKICLTSWQVAQSAGGAPFGAQLVDAILKLTNVFTSPTTAGTTKWTALFTPYLTNSTTPNPAETWEARAFVPLPVVLTIKVSYVKKTNAWRLSGTLTEGGNPVPKWTIRIGRGRSASSLTSQSSTTTSLGGVWKTAGHLQPKRTTFFQARATAQERDYTQAGCANPDATFVPAGCKSATLPAWTVTSAVVRVKR